MKSMRSGGAWALALALAALPTAAAAQQGRCVVPAFRGALSPAGANASMSVLNDGRPCAIANLGSPGEGRQPAHELRVTLAPANGRVEIQGHRVLYTPNPGYAGLDVFAYEGLARDNHDQPRPLKVRVDVTVRGAAERRD